MLMFGSVIWNNVDQELRYHHAYTDIIFAVCPSANIPKGIQLILSHICISVLVLYQHDDLFGDFVKLGMFYCFQHI